MPRKPSSATLAELRAVGGGGAFESAQDVEPFLHDFRRLYHGATPLVLQPRETAEVAEILRICNREQVAVVPHGGNTSYCGGATPDESGSQVVISMRRMNRIRRIDANNYSLIVEAGCTLAAAQAAAQAENRLFPLSLGSEGSAQIGGNLSTNAGGTAVLRYGMMRDLVLGLEVVLADGRILSALKALRKDNTGYDVKSLFIGAEGTLGLITAACLKLFPQPADTATALAGLDSPQHALELLVRLRGAAGDQVTSFELMPRGRTDGTVCRRSRRPAGAGGRLVRLGRALFTEPPAGVERAARRPVGAGGRGRNDLQRGDRFLRPTGRSDVETARDGAGGAKPSWREPQTRCFGSDIRAAAPHPRGHPLGRAPRAGG